MKLTWDFSELTDFTHRLQNQHDLDTALMTATQQIAKLLHKQLLTNTPVKTGNLRKMWSADGNLLFTVKRVANGFQVTIVNNARNGSSRGFKYGLAVNDGHRTPSGAGWVMGRFFVEASIVQTANSAQLNNIIMKELQKWWRSV
jgi:hypothetical protein